MRESRDATLEVDPIPFAAPDRSLTATFIGNATVLFKLAGTTVLTDPSFLHAGDHAHVGYGIFARRLLDPALRPRELPHLDAVVLSHLHAGHWDRVAERELERELPIVTTPQAARTLEERGFTCAIPLELWKTLELNSPSGPALRITALPALHGPRPLNRLLPETHGHMFESTADGGKPFRIYVSGDTLMFEGIAEIAKRFPEIDVAFVHLGGTRIPHRRVGAMVTLDAKGGVEMLRVSGAKHAVPIHTDDWSLFGSSLDDFLDFAREADLLDRVRVIPRGDTLDLSTLRVKSSTAFG